MKVSPTANSGSKADSKPVAPIPLERPEIPEFNKSEGQTYKLRTVPTDNNSPGYEVSIRYFSSGTCEEFLIFEDDLKRVIKGQNLTTGPQRFEVARRLLTGGALTTFNQALPPGDSETVASYDICMNAVRVSVFPKHANVNQRRLMRTGMRKPLEMKIQQFVDRMRELNSYLTRFPPISSTAPAKKLDDDEFIEAINASIPNTWKKQLAFLGFLPHENDIAAFVDKCQCFEAAELNDSNPSGKKNQGTNKDESSQPNKKKKGKDNNKNQKGKPGQKFNKDGLLMCDMHKHAHPFQQCEVMLGQMRRMMGMYEAQDSNERRKKRKQEKEFRELNTVEGISQLVNKSVQAALSKQKKSNKRQKKDLNTFQRLSISSDASESSESEDERSLIDVPSSSDEE